MDVNSHAVRESLLPVYSRNAALFASRAFS
jgi:hypothetical protein